MVHGYIGYIYKYIYIYIYIYIYTYIYIYLLYIYLYTHKFTSKCHSQTTLPWSQEVVLAPPPDKQTRNYDTRVLKPPFLPNNLKVKGIEP